MEKDIDESKWNKVLKNGKTYGENYRQLQKLDNLWERALSSNDRKKASLIRAEMKKLYKVFGPTGRPVYVEHADYVDARGRYKIAQITKRKCGEKQQPELQVGRRYFIVGRDKTPTGIDVVLLADLKSYDPKKKNFAAIRCNAKRFEWKELTQTDASIESMSYFKPVVENIVSDIVKNGLPETPEEKMKREVQHDVKLFMDKLTTKEQMNVSFVPLVIYELSWMYAMEARTCAVRDKVALLKKQSRHISELYSEYQSELKKDLDYKRFNHLREQADMCRNVMSRDLAILYFTVNNEFKRCVPDYPYDEMRSKAIISQLLFSFAVKWNQDIDKFLAEKFTEERFTPTLLPPTFKKLYGLMEAVAGVDGKFNYTERNIVTAMCVIENRIRHIEFVVVDDKD